MFIRVVQFLKIEESSSLLVFGLVSLFPSLDSIPRFRFILFVCPVGWFVNRAVYLSILLFGVFGLFRYGSIGYLFCWFMFSDWVGMDSLFIVFGFLFRTIFCLFCWFRSASLFEVFGRCFWIRYVSANLSAARSRFRLFLFVIGDFES